MNKSDCCDYIKEMEKIQTLLALKLIIDDCKLNFALPEDLPNIDYLQQLNTYFSKSSAKSNDALSSSLNTTITAPFLTSSSSFQNNFSFGKIKKDQLDQNVSDNFFFNYHFNDQEQLKKLVPLSYIGGVDIYFSNCSRDKSKVGNEEEEFALGALVILEYPSLNLVYYTTLKIPVVESSFFLLSPSLSYTISVPYIPGFLAFRELHLKTLLLEEIKYVAPYYYPQLLFVDGNGIYHPRNFGLACHVGVVCDIPTIGCAKSFLKIGNFQGYNMSAFHSKDSIKDIVPTVNRSYPKIIPLFGLNSLTDFNEDNINEIVLGFAALTGNSTRKPIFVSPGHRISLSTALKMTLRVCLYRIPEPIRLADKISRRCFPK